MSLLAYYYTEIVPLHRKLERMLFTDPDGTFHVPIYEVSGTSYIPVRKATQCRVCGEILPKGQTEFCDPDPSEEI